MCMGTWYEWHMHNGGHRSEGAQDPPEPELQTLRAAVWVLRTEAWSLEEQ